MAASGAYYELEITDESLVNNRETAVSQSFRSDRQVPGVTKVSETSSGDVNIETKYANSISELYSGALQSNWANNVVTNGRTRKSYTVEKEFYDPGGTGDNFQIFLGAEISTWSAELAVGQFFTQTFGFTARDYETGNATISVSNSNVITAPATKFMNAVEEDIVIEVNGVPLESGIIQNIQWTLDNNMREQRGIGSTALSGMGSGRFSVTGTMQVYWNGSNPLYTAYKNEQSVELDLEIPDPDGNGYGYTFHSLFLQSAPAGASGLDQDVILEIPFTATMNGDPTPKTLSIRRFTA
ncbi:MAG: hypothetical protein ABS78_19430 [Phenylobacterium sp. SCN 70-31]|nr:MAG: hypothetical protein ABS78_19430 [Phenylobacterium sp. SCN 70-31]